MHHWWEVETPDVAAKVRAVAYYRHSAQDRQENSIPLQRDQVREWAQRHGVEIVQEFADAGKSGLTVEGRPGFTEMMDEWVKKRQDFEYVLCLDVSRWGRFQDIDLSAQYSAECKRHGKLVIYTAIGKPREDDPFYPVYVQFERFRAAQYSKELSDEVWRGCMRIAEQGYWAGGTPPFGMQRLLLDEQREPVHTLEPGQRKGIQNQRVTLVGGDADQVQIVQRIFHEFVELGHSEYRIAEGLNAEGVPSPSGRRWGAGSVLARLRNETYAGTLLYNRTSQKLRTPCRPNPPEEWVRTPEAFEGIIPPDQFLRAQEILEERRRKYDPQRMLGQLDALYKQYGVFRASLLRLLEDFAAARLAIFWPCQVLRPSRLGTSSQPAARGSHRRDRPDTLTWLGLRRQMRGSGAYHQWGLEHAARDVLHPGGGVLGCKTGEMIRRMSIRLCRFKTLTSHVLPQTVLSDRRC